MNIGVSVVVPVYNRKERLRVVLKSLLEQDYNYEYEIVVVDDGSTDGSCDKLDELDQKIVVVRQDNTGAAGARHRGVKEARGEIIIFHDSDDIASKDKISVLTQALEKTHQCDVAFAITKGVHDNWKKPAWALNLESNAYFIFEDPLLHYFSFTHPLAGAMNIAMYKDMAMIASSDNTFYKAANDYHLQFKAAKLTSFVGVNSITNYYYTGSENSISNNYGIEKQEMYALFSLVENYTNLGRSFDRYKENFQTRVEGDAPRIILHLLLHKNLGKNFLRVIKIMLKYARIYKLPKTFYWAFTKLSND